MCNPINIASRYGVDMLFSYSTEEWEEDISCKIMYKLKFPLLVLVFLFTGVL